ncbi:MAG: DUF5996 family protein [Chloroflexota bacterium]|nr:MAG: hypothetical protein DLM70_12410 [Chloroflexota bacterium]
MDTAIVTDRETLEQAWPPLPFEEWQHTCDTLHMWCQIVGKVKLKLTPFLNELWEVAFHLTARGMTTSLIPYGNGAFEVTFDFIDHNLSILSSDGTVKALPLIPRSVADFYQEFMATLRSMDIDVIINTTPTEVPNPIPCDQDSTHASYDPEYVHRWWRIQLQTAKVLQRYRSPFVGKSSPVHFFWGSFDLNHARYSGRPATPPEGPRFFRLAENQENVACGFWPGNANAAGVSLGEPAFYSYIYPAPPGYEEASVRPDAAHYHDALGQFILRYEDARRAPDPGRVTLDFFESTHEAAATLARWDRGALEKKPWEA